jgi:hypothetical protein
MKAGPRHPGYEPWVTSLGKAAARQLTVQRNVPVCYTNGEVREIFTADYRPRGRNGNCVGPGLKSSSF